MRKRYIVGALLAAISAVVSANAQAGPAARSSASVSLNDLVLTGGKAEMVEYQGRKAVRLTTQPSTEEVFAFLPAVQIQDGTIEADIAMKSTTPPGVRFPGFVGIAFRSKADASHYDLFYLRPGNALSEDQAMRNHAYTKPWATAPNTMWAGIRNTASARTTAVRNE